MYHPRGGVTPAYETYADPAAAHGWQNTYDETAELPQVADGPAPPAAPPEHRVASHGRGHRKRRGAGAGRSRRVAVAAGVAGTVSAAVLIAWFSFSGSPGGAPGEHDRRTPAAGDTATAPDPATSTDPGSGDRPSDGSGPAAPTTAGTPSTSPAAPTTAPAAEGGTKPPSPDPTPTTSQTPTDSAPGNSDARPGRGQGASKGPR